MSYTPTEWKDHIVEHPNRFRVVDNGDGTVNILDEHGNIIQQGTPVNAANLNKMEQGIKEGITKAEQAQQTADDAATAAANAQSDIDEYKNELTSLGIGFNINPPRIAEDLDNEISVGWVRFETGETLNRPSDEIPNFPHSGVVRVDRRHVNRLVQTAYGVAGNTDVRIAIRTLGSTGWGNWVEALHTGNTGNLVRHDWEVGSFTPSFTTSGNPIQSITYDSSGTSGSYVKIANLVYVRLNIRTRSVQKGNASGDLRISGLPFPFGTEEESRFAGFNIARILNFDQAADQSYPIWKIGMPPNSNYLVIFNFPPSASSATVAGPEILRNHSSGTSNTIAITGMYYTFV